MDINVDGNDLLAVVAKQRNDALDEAANNAARVAALMRKIEELEKKLADATGNASGQA